MKIDKVLDAHGIGIVKMRTPLEPNPETGIVTDGLVGYWNTKQGATSDTWANIAPATIGQYDASFFQIAVREDGIYFNGSTSYAQLPIPTELKSVTNATYEMRFRLDYGVVDMINQSDGRELVWLDYTAIVLSGIFDANKYQDHMNVYVPPLQGVTLYLTITADRTTNRITAYVYNPVTGVTTTDFYTTTIGTISNGDAVILSGTSARFSGTLDSIRMYNRVLSPEEIAQNRTVLNDVGL